MAKRGFTLIEVMIVVFIIGILAAIAVPQFLSARASSRQKSCLSTLRQINDAKDQWAMAGRKPDGAACTQADIVPDYLKKIIACPDGGSYSVEVVGKKPTCSIGAAGRWPHVLP